jgi:hypothetical protein
MKYSEEDLMFVRLKFLDSRQFTGQLCGVVDQNGEMLRADKEMAVLVFQADQGNILAGTFTDQASMVVVGHDTSKEDK